MALIKTVQAGNWFNSQIWDLGRVPTIGDRAEVNHLVYASDNVSVGDGSLNALVLNAPLVCYSNLSVIGRVYSISTNAGLFFLKETLDWVFYASEGFYIPPMSQEALTSLWENVFGGQPPEGYLMPVAGYISKETIFMPNQHPVADPLKERLSALPFVVNAHLSPSDPKNAITAYISTLSTTGLVSPNDLLSAIQQIQAINSAATDINENFQISATLLIEPVLFLWLWVKNLAGDAAISVKETENKFEVLIAQPTNLNDAILTVTTLMQGLNPVQSLFSAAGITKTVQINLL